MAFQRWAEYVRVGRYELLTKRIVRAEEAQRKLLLAPLTLVLRGRRDAELERVTVLFSLFFVFFSFLSSVHRPRLQQPAWPPASPSLC
eukprot:2214447-Pyramimonas_sp.AAC.1